MNTPLLCILFLKFANKRTSKKIYLCNVMVGKGTCLKKVHPISLGKLEEQKIWRICTNTISWLYKPERPQDWLWKTRWNFKQFSGCVWSALREDEYIYLISLLCCYLSLLFFIRLVPNKYLLHFFRGILIMDKTKSETIWFMKRLKENNKANLLYTAYMNIFSIIHKSHVLFSYGYIARHSSFPQPHLIYITGPLHDVLKWTLACDVIHQKNALSIQNHLFQSYIIMRFYGNLMVTVSHGNSLLNVIIICDSWMRWSHLCSSVVLFSDGLISLLACCVPACKHTSDQPRRQSQHCENKTSRAVTYHICIRTLMPSISKVFILKSTPGGEKTITRITSELTKGKLNKGADYIHFVKKVKSCI